MAKSGVDVFGAPINTGDLVIFAYTEKGYEDKRLSVRDSRMVTGRVLRFGTKYMTLEVMDPVTMIPKDLPTELRVPKGVIKIEVVQNEPEA